MFPFEQFLQAKSSFFVAQGNIVNLSIGVLLLVAVAVQALKGKSRFTIRIAIALIITLQCYAYFTLYITDVVPVAFRLWRQGAAYTIALVVLAPLLIRSTTSLKHAYQAFLLFGSIIALGLLLGVNWERRSIAFAEAGMSIAGEKTSTGAPLAIASFGGSLCLVSGFYRPSAQTKIWNTLRIVAFLLGIGLAIKTESRGQIIAVFATYALLFQARKRQAKSSLVLGVAAVSFLALSFVFLVLPILDSGRWVRLEEHFQDRVRTAVLMVESFVDGGPIIWLFGSGAASSWKILGTYPHNVFAEVLYEEGAIGFMLLVFFTSYTFRNYFIVKRKSDCDDDTFSIYTATVALFLLHFILALKQGSLYSSQDFFAHGIVADRIGSYILANFPRRRATAPQHQRASFNDEPHSQR
jgi:hypothetical protein